MALFQTKFLRGIRIVLRNIQMSANIQQKAVEAMEKMKSENPYFDKYAAKIAKVQQSSPEKFLSKLQKQEDEKRKEAQIEKDRNYSELMNPKTSVDSKAEIPLKKLEDIMKIELLKDKSSEEIRAIWLEYHKSKDVIAAVIPVDTFNDMMEVAKKYPTFIFPIPRSLGFEFIMFQFAANTIHFTPLLVYQVHKENAPECLNIVHYTEFVDQGVVLMRGEYDTKVLTAQEAQCLANQLKLYYTQTNSEKLNLLECFTNTPEKFKHMDVIKELENLQIK